MDTIVAYFVQLFGQYEPIQNIASQTTITESVSGNDVVTETITYCYNVDWTYILTVVIYGILFYCLLRILGGILCGKD